MRIAMLTNNYRPFVGGVPISVERQAQELVRLGHDVNGFLPLTTGIQKRREMLSGGRMRRLWRMSSDIGRGERKWTTVWCTPAVFPGGDHEGI